MTDDRRPFDVGSFLSSIDAHRSSKGLKWNEVAAAVSVSPSTLTRLRQGSRPDVDTFFRLCSWANLSPDEFDLSRPAEALDDDLGALPAIAAALRADRSLDEEDARLLEDILRAAYTRLKSPSED